jgi:outer membrane protein OmpA-like peptidoglycan-associated protein
METQMSHRTLLWRDLAAVGTIALLAGCAQTQSPAMVASNPPPVPPGAGATWYHIEFATGSHAIGAQGELTVADVTNFMQQNPNAIATIIGKTDTVGSANYNMHLSHQRADTVRDALVYHSNVAAERVETRWTGETRQRVAAAANEPAEANRVVDIAVH